MNIQVFLQLRFLRIAAMSQVMFAIATFIILTAQGTTGEDFLATSLGDQYSSVVYAVSGSSDGWAQEKSSRLKLDLTPYSLVTFTVMQTTRIKFGLENKSLVYSLSDDVSLYVYHHADMYSVLPISGLGRKYIVSSCHASDNYTTVLVVASHSYRTDVDITFRLEGSVSHDNQTYRDGDTLRLLLGQYQTLTISSGWDLSGSVVESQHTVAVFSGMVKDSVVQGYEQLLPVKFFGSEYIIATEDEFMPRNKLLQVVGEDPNITITFNSGSTVVVNEKGLYQQNLSIIEHVYFNTSRPVMATLCAVSPPFDSFTVISPVELYLKRTSFNFQNIFHVITTMNNVNVVARTNSTEEVSGEWSRVTGTDYHVKTYRQGHQGETTTVTSSAPFNVMIYNGGRFYNGGYNFRERLCIEGSYGPDCKHCAERHCTGQALSCDHVTGACDGGCQVGWRGTDCTQRLQCVDGMYGSDCSQACSSRNCKTQSSGCDDLTGLCTDRCRDGWTEPDCRTPCVGGTYGPSCNMSCNLRFCQTQSSCDHVTGICQGGCQEGWFGADCQQICRKGSYGKDCTRCGHCDVTCDASDGHCPGQCLEGFSGVRCDEDQTENVLSPLTAGLVGATVGIAVSVLMLVGIMCCFLRMGRLQWMKTGPQEIGEKDTGRLEMKTSGYTQPDLSTGCTDLSTGCTDLSTGYTDLSTGYTDLSTGDSNSGSISPYLKVTHLDHYDVISDQTT